MSRPMPAATCSISAPGDMTAPVTSGKISGTQCRHAALGLAGGADLHDLRATRELPNLGYMNDLLYTAAAICAGIVQRCHLRQQHLIVLLRGHRWPVLASDGWLVSSPAVTAAPGYDLTTGLGTPNGTLLARALYDDRARPSPTYASTPDVLRQRRRRWLDEPHRRSGCWCRAMSSKAASIDVSGGNTTSPRQRCFRHLRLDQPVRSAGRCRPISTRQLDALVRQAGAWRAWDSPRPSADGSLHCGNRPGRAAGHGAQRGTLSNAFGFVDFVGIDGNVVRVASPCGGCRDGGRRHRPAGGGPPARRTARITSP